MCVGWNLGLGLLRATQGEEPGTGSGSALRFLCGLNEAGRPGLLSSCSTAVFLEAAEPEA